MSRTVSSRQAEMIGRSERSYLPIVKLQPYTDRGAGTLGTAIYFAPLASTYDYGNTAAQKQLWPLLARIDGTLSQRMNHIPDDASRGDIDGGRTLTVVLQNLPMEYEDDLLIVYLRSLGIEFAQLELAQLDIDRIAKQHGYDLSSLTGDEHTVWARMEVAKVGPITQGSATRGSEITLPTRSREPEIPWTWLNTASTNDPRDLGKRVPMPYGYKRVECLGVDVGFATTLAQTITSSTTGSVLVTDSSGFSGTFEIRIGGEGITGCTVVDATHISLGTRGAYGNATAHLQGTPLVEVQSNAVWTCGIGVTAISAVYAKNIYADEIVTVQSSRYSTSTAGTVEGVTAATITISNTNLRALLADMLASPAVTTQPTFPGDVGISFDSPTYNAGHSARITNGANAFDGDNSTYAVVQQSSGGTDGALAFTLTPAGTISSTIEIQVNKGGSRSLHFWYSTDGGSNWSEITLNNDGTTPIIGIASGWWGAATSTSPIVCPSNANMFKIVNVSTSADENVYEVVATYRYTPDLGDVTIVGAEVGFGLRLFADVSGPQASGGHYTASNGTVLQTPGDILRHIIAERCGEGYTEAFGKTVPDSTTFDDTNWSTFNMALDLVELGDAFGPVTARIAFEAAGNLVLEEGSTGGLWKLHRPSLSSGDYTFTASTILIDDWGEGFVDEGRDTDSIFTRFRCLYNRDVALGTGEQSFRASLRADADQNDLGATYVADAKLTAAETSYGRRDHPGFAFLCIADSYAAKYTFGYLVQEHMRGARTFTVPGVPWDQAYAIERGDIRLLADPWSAGSTIDVRIVGYDKDFSTERVTLRAVEVLT